MKILIAIDESTSTDEIVRSICKQIRPDQAEVRLLHVLEPIAASVPPQMAPGYAPELEAFAHDAKRLLARTEKTLRAVGFKTDTLLKNGDIRESIIDAAAEWNADLIILGSHNRTGAHRFLLGSVAESVARHAPCSVEIVRAPHQRAA
ncbi:MAG TPA: universal stress protein [Candidatus Limnocylindrales bacterium]|nr:universal stress protein [Candidatus Limnocylindrales bacterium]